MLQLCSQWLLIASELLQGLQTLSAQFQDGSTNRTVPPTGGIL